MVQNSYSQNNTTIHILHVDDDPSLLEISKEILMEIGKYEIDHALGVDEAFKKISINSYDLIVSDYEMPQKDGLRFLKELRERNIQTPFILFTGKGREEVAVKALNLGADGYYNKQGSPETVYGELSHSINLIVERNQAKKALQEQEIRFTKLTSQTPGMLFQFLRRPNGTYCLPFASAGIQNIFGCSPKDVENDFSPISKMIIPEDLQRVIQSIEKSAKNLSPWQCEYRVKLPKQEIHWMLGQSIPEKLEDGSVLWNGFSMDISERKLSEEKLRETVEILERVGEGIDAGLAIIGKDFHIVWANKRLMDLGVSPNKKCYQTFNRLETVCPDCGAKKIFENNLPFDVHEFKTVNAKGETTWIELRVTPLKDKKGNTTAAVELAVDITERKKAEQVLAESVSKYRLLADNMSDTIWIADLENHFTYASPSVLQLRGYTPEEVMKQSIFEALTPASAQILLGVIHHFQETGEMSSRNYELEQSCKDGSTVWTEVNLTILRDEKGHPRSILGASRNITKRKKTENMLKESEEKFRNLAEESPNMIFINKSGRVIYANKKCEEKMGYLRSELYSPDFSFISLIASESADTLKSAFSKHMKGEEVDTYEYYLVTKGGHKIAAEINSKLICYEGENVILGVVTDITERKNFELQLKSSESRYKELFSKMPNGVVVYEVINNGEDFTIRDFNKAAEHIEKISNTEVVGKRITEVFPGAKNLGLLNVFQRVFQTGKYEFLPISIYKDTKNQESWRENWVYKLPNGNIVAIYNDVTERKKIEDELLKNKILLLEAEKVGKIGGFEIDVNTLTQNWTEETFHILDLELAQGEPIVSKGIEFINPEYRSKANAAIQRAIEHGEPFDQEWEITTLKGNRRWVHALGRANWENGKIKTISGSFQDITEHKMIEQKLIENNNRIEMLNEKLRIVGGLTRHDVANKIAVIGSNEFLLRKRLSDKPELTRYLDSIKKAVENSNDLFEFSRLYEKIGSEKLTVIDVFKSFNQAAALFSNQSALNIVNKCQGLTVVADSLLKHLFYNFIDNSVKHGKKVTEIRLHYTKKCDEIKLFYEDNGDGIPEDMKPMLFNIGLPERNIGGLGMYLAKKLMHVYGWSITEEGQQGKGVKFTMTIPKIHMSTKKSISSTKTSKKKTTVEY